MQKLFLLTITAMCALGTAAAQDIKTYKQQLSRPAENGARVEVREYGDAAAIISNAPAGDQTRKVQGFRVRIFFDNSPNARTAGNETLTKFKELFPDIPADIYYENPYFKVTVGNCRTWDEVNILKGRILGTFDKAFVVREEIPLSAFTVRESEE